MPLLPLPISLLNLCAVVLLAGIGAGAMALAYRTGRPAWSERFDLRYTVGSKLVRRKGEYGELGMIGLAAGVLLFIDVMTDDVSVLGVATRSPAVSLGLIGGIVLSTGLYGQFICWKVARREASKDAAYLHQLRRGYVPYTLYSSVNVAFLVLAAVLLLFQIDADLARLRAERAEIAGELEIILSGAPIPAELLQSRIEFAYGNFLIGTSVAIDLVNTLLLCVIAGLLINLALNFTPLRRSYEPETIRAFNFGVVGVCITVLLLSWLSYFTNYLSLVDDFQAALEQIRPRMTEAPWQISRRYFEMHQDLSQRRGFLGFMLAVVQERGSFLLVVTGIQVFLSSRREFRDALVKPVGPQ